MTDEAIHFRAHPAGVCARHINQPATAPCGEARVANTAATYYGQCINIEDF